MNNYKEYSTTILRRLLLFNKVKSFGFTLNESAEIISLLDANLASCDRISKVTSEKISVIDKKIAELKALKKLLADSVRNCMTGYEIKSDEINCPLFEIK